MNTVRSQSISQTPGSKGMDGRKYEISISDKVHVHVKFIVLLSMRSFVDAKEEKKECGLEVC